MSLGRSLMAVLLAMAALGYPPAWGMPLLIPDSGAENMLARIFSAIGQERWSDALRETDVLIAAYPNFRLAHLIRGDLLQARARPIARFGEGALPLAPGQVSDLREEAIARLRAQREKPRPDAVPRHLLQLAPSQQYALVVDAGRARMYLYRNDNGTPRFVADYYVSHGRLGVGKQQAGDKKTPVGVYRVTASIPRRKLSNFYGSGALPIDYPNSWDKMKGHNGHGIWLHGVPPDTFARPPKASDGCVVLANADFEQLARIVQTDATPVIISDHVEWLSFEEWQNERRVLQQAFEEWRRDWESLDVERYGRHYARGFVSGERMNRAAWLEYKKRINAAKSWIKVRVDDISMLRGSGGEEYVVISFAQDYRSSNLSEHSRKRQFWIREDGRWKILIEETL